MRRYSYPLMSKHLGSFELAVNPGEFTDSEIIVMLGENGTGKTTFIRLMAGYLAPDSGGRAASVLSRQSTTIPNCPLCPSQRRSPP